MNYLNEILRKKSYGSANPGKVTSVLIIPDFTKQLEIEAKIQDLKDLKMLLSIQEPSCLDCFIPKKYRDDQAFEKNMDTYDNQLAEETMKPFVSSGHAFICFDSVNSLNTVMKHFRTTPSQHIKIFFIGIAEKISYLCNWLMGKDVNDL